MNDLEIENCAVTDEEINTILSHRDHSSTTSKLNDIRAISNIQQALENLVVQCSVSDKFKSIERFALDTLGHLDHEMRLKIHS